MIGQLVLSVIFGRSIDFICDVVVDIALAWDSVPTE